MIVTKTEIEFGEQSCQTNHGTSTYGETTIDYVKAHHRMSYEDPGPSSVQPHNDQWLDDKHFMTPQSQNSNTGNSTSNSATSNDDSEQRCKTKNFKALEPCSCPLCARVYSNVNIKLKYNKFLMLSSCSFAIFRFRICDNICDSFIIQHRFVVRYVKSHSHPICISNGIICQCMVVRFQLRP